MSIYNINWVINSSPVVSNIDNCTLYENYIINTNSVDFNFLARFFNELDLSAHITQPLPAQDKVFENFFQIRNVHQHDPFKSLHDLINEQFNIDQINSDSDIFFSFVKGFHGITYENPYDVYLLNLHDELIYRVNDKNVHLKANDLLYIPMYTPHYCISIYPRITLSFGMRGDIERQFPWELTTTTEIPFDLDNYTPLP